MKKLLLLLLAFTLVGTSVWAQGQQVTGKVTSGEDGQPLPGVSVIVQGTTKGTATDAEGVYSLQLADGETTLVFSFVGYTSQTVTVSGRTTIDVVLAPDMNMLQEVVVVGYGTQSKQDVTGSIVSVKGADVAKQPNINPLSALQGRVAGVNITNSGAPGSSPQVRIRGLGTVYGNANPLYVVDGVWYDDIQFLNPNDIESISVLKDASSQAIYGIRAANGVILVTTNRGNKEQAPRITYNGSVGNQLVAKQLEMATGPQFAEMINELDAINGIATPRYADPSSYGTTDWYRQILRNALISNHNLSLTGGTEKSNYNFSLGYVNQQGTVKDNNFERYTVRLQNDFNPLKGVKLGYTLAGAFAKERGFPGGIFHQLYSAAPIVPVYYADGTYGDPNDFSVGNSNAFNPQVTIDFFQSNVRSYRMTGNVYGEVNFLKDFTFRSSFGGELGQVQSKQYNPVYTATLTQRNTISSLNIGRGETRNWILENTLTYNKTLGEHKVTVLLGQGAQRYQNYFLNASAQNVPNSSSGDHYINLGDNRLVSDGGELTTVTSYFGRLNYSYKDKYLLTATLRRDGTSKFAAANKTDLFPSVGLGWVISEEGFMADQNIFDNLKLRASWGAIGNLSVPANVSLQRVTQNFSYLYVGGDGSTAAGANIDTQVPLTTFWEYTEGTDVGLEAAFFNSKLNVELDWYRKTTYDAIFPVSIPPNVGTSSGTLLGNQASFRNQGIEVAVNWQDELNSEIRYSVGLNMAFNNNEVVDVAAQGSQLFFAVGTTGSNNFNKRTVVGEPIGQFYGLKVVGVFQSDEDRDAYVNDSGNPIQPTAVPGDFKYADVNGDGLIDDKDRVVLGNPNPRMIYGLNTNWSYKNFDLTLDFQGVAGVEVYNATLGARFGTENFTREFYENRWNGEGTSNSWPSANIGGGQNYRSNSFFVESGDYFRVRNIQLGYTVPGSLVSKYKINSLRVFANAQNALQFFKYRGLNPEVNGDIVTGGVDSNVYPVFATYNVGVNLTF